jgi:acyl carrier protein
VPIGVAGELLIGGAGVARGYLNRPELTAEKFIADPFDPSGEGRLYRTGDLVRYRPDGELEYLGRSDQQVKIRGFRVELGEVEAALNAHAGVAACAVAASEHRLVAYLVGDADADALRAHLRASLPDYMVPSAFVRLEALPLTPNGKVDRKALPAPGAADLATGAYVAPRSHTETVLAGIFAEVLGLERVGVDDDFFALGGHSLLATQIASRVREAFDVELPLHELFGSPTIGQIAGVLGRDPDERHRIERTAEILIQLAEMSDDEADALLADASA